MTQSPVIGCAGSEIDLRGTWMTLGAVIAFSMGLKSLRSSALDTVGFVSCTGTAAAAEEGEREGEEEEGDEGLALGAGE